MKSDASWRALVFLFLTVTAVAFAWSGTEELVCQAANAVAAEDIIPVTRCVEFWFNRYQGLAAGMLALAAAGIAARFAIRQNNLLRTQIIDTRYERDAAHATAGLTIAKIANRVAVRARITQEFVRQGNDLPSRTFGDEWSEPMFTEFIKLGPITLVAPFIALIDRCTEFNHRSFDYQELMEELNSINVQAEELVGQCHEDLQKNSADWERRMDV